MKHLNEFINESRDEVYFSSPRSLASDLNEENFPIFKFPDGKEYIVKTYKANHSKNGKGEFHQGLEFIEYKN